MTTVQQRHIPESQTGEEARAFLLSLGFERDRIVAEYRFTWRTPEGTLQNDVCDWVAFARAPHTMRTACIAVVDIGARPESELLQKLSFLSTPLVLTLTSTAARMWSLRRDLKPDLVQEAPRDAWRSTFADRLSTLSPERLLAAKQGDAQLSFVDAGLAEWAERITGETLVRLLERLLATALEQMPKDLRHTDTYQRNVVRLVFQLFACRVLEDNGIIGSDLSPAEALQQAADRFSENLDPQILRARGVNAALVKEVHGTLLRRFAFAGLTTDMLGHAYRKRTRDTQFSEGPRDLLHAGGPHTVRAVATAN